MNRSFLLAAIAVWLAFPLCRAQITADNDTLFARQRPLFEKLNVFQAWEITRGCPKVLIGCIDNGFDYYHPYLHDRLLPGYYSDGSYHPMTYQTMGHGTLVSSLMVANPKRPEGMHGLAPECRVLTASYGCIEHILREVQAIRKANPGMSLQGAMQEISRDTVMVREWSQRWITYVGTAVACSIRYLVEHGVKVINISGEIVAAYPPLIQQQIDEAFDFSRQKNVLLVISAGNSDREILSTLKSYENVIMVGASTLNDERWTMTVGGITQGSNWGELLDVCAPIDSLVICQPSDARYYKSDDGPMGAEDVPYKSGLCDIIPIGATSSAAPIVSSLAALVYSIAPKISASEVKRAILEGCDDIGEPGVDHYTGHGRINFGKTISLVGIKHK